MEKDKQKTIAIISFVEFDVNLNRSGEVIKLTDYDRLFQSHIYFLAD